MENVDMHAVEAILWFFGGIFTYRFLTRMLNYGYMINMYKEVLFSVLMLLKMADDNYVKINKVVRDTGIKAGQDETEVELEFNSNIRALEMWRNLTIATITQMTPRSLRGLVQFKNWHQAI